MTAEKFNKLMPTKYVFFIRYFRKEGKERILYEECIVAETWDQAQKYWQPEFLDEGVEIILIQKDVAIIAILPQDKR